jgi:hypothetical protein
VYPGVYKFEAHDFFCQGVFTAKTPTDSYRGAGRPEATFAIGVSVYTEMGGLAPSRWLGQQGYSVGGWETASVRLLPTGRV